MWRVLEIKNSTKLVPDDLVCFFLSSTCMTVIWNSTIIRTARKRRLGSCFLELPCQYFYPPSLVLCTLELSFLSFSLFHDPLFYSFYRFFYNIFFLPFVFWSMFHHFHSLLFNLFQKTKYTLTSSVFRCCLTGLSLCLTHIFIFHNITTCQDRQPSSCMLLLLTHITLKWSKRKGHIQTTECFKTLAF